MTDEPENENEVTGMMAGVVTIENIDETCFQLISAVIQCPHCKLIAAHNLVLDILQDCHDTYGMEKTEELCETFITKTREAVESAKNAENADVSASKVTAKAPDTKH